MDKHFKRHFSYHCFDPVYQANTELMTEVQITAHHKGYLEYQLCPQDDQTLTAEELEACLIANPLEVGDGGYKWYLPDAFGGTNKTKKWCQIKTEHYFIRNQNLNLFLIAHKPKI